MGIGLRDVETIELACENGPYTIAPTRAGVRRQVCVRSELSRCPTKIQRALHA